MTNADAIKFLSLLINGLKTRAPQMELEQEGAIFFHSLCHDGLAYGRRMADDRARRDKSKAL